MPGIRVIAGEAKGRKLKMVPGEGTRPVGDRVKESLFNILGPDVVDAVFLDLFAGTGSVGIEALSRGAARAVFVDDHRAAVRTITANLETTRLQDRAVVKQRDAFAYLRAEPPEAFDIVYLAPPQYQGLWSKALVALDERTEWLSPDALVVVQIDPKEESSVELTRLVPDDRRRYGNTMLLFFRLPGV
ncbi:MAG TPA: 16S rRNA (guanine(966)-N(2))-methyltransferase RsmD [Anaerolineales bacterium]|nr:16S rRNA (guanine(966)-N(2))-methyltransferase RsmD [Anaerolineales bacterium]